MAVFFLFIFVKVEFCVQSAVRLSKCRARMLSHVPDHYPVVVSSCRMMSGENGSSRFHRICKYVYRIYCLSYVNTFRRKVFIK